MVTKIFLGLAIACGIGAAVIGFLFVKPRILTAEENWKKFEADFHNEQSAHGATKTELATTKMTLDTTKMELDTTKTALAAKTTEAEGLAQQVTKLEGEKTDLGGKLAKAIAENEEFQKFGKSMQDIRATFEKLPKVERERDAYVTESKVLALENKKLQGKILELTGGPAILPESLTGKVVAVDPKFQFVVLNVGLDSGVKPNGEMIVNRDGKMIGEVRITHAEKEYCYANILQGKTLLAEVAEGDEVVVSKYKNIQKKAP
jgi:hypothetical protein